jgi:hypothetical protein
LSRRAYRSSLSATTALSAEVAAVLTGIRQELQLSASLEVLLACPADRPLSAREKLCVSSLEARYPSLKKSRNTSANVTAEPPEQQLTLSQCSLCGCELFSTAQPATSSGEVLCFSCGVAIPRCVRSGRLCTTTTTFLSPSSAPIKKLPSAQPRAKVQAEFSTAASQDGDVADIMSSTNTAPVLLRHELLQCSLCSSIVIADLGLRDGELQWTGWYNMSPQCMFCALPLEVLL